MGALKYTVIKTRKQYREYSDELERLVTQDKQTKTVAEETELLQVLIEKWDAMHNSFGGVDPVQLLEGLMAQRGMSATMLAALLGKSKGLISDILNYKKAFSKEMIRQLANEFKVSQEAFNRVYPLTGSPRNEEIKVDAKIVARHASKDALLPKKRQSAMIFTGTRSAIKHMHK